MAENLEKKLKVIVLREELFVLTGDTYKAIILGQFIYWQERVRDFDKFILEERERRKKVGEVLNIQPQNGWMYKSAKDLISECMLTISESTLRRNLRSLIEKGFLEERSNPSNKWDKCLQYRVNISYIIKKLIEMGYNGLSGYKLMNDEKIQDKEDSSILQNNSSILQNDESNQQNEEAITEITTEITNKDIKGPREQKFLGTSKKSSKKDEQFERCWIAYKRKGNKSRAYNIWLTLSKGDRDRAEINIPVYVESRESVTYQKDFERYLKYGIYNIKNSEFQVVDLEECKDLLFTEFEWQKSIMSSYEGMNVEIFIFCINQFFMKLENEGCDGKSVIDAKSHFESWLNINYKKVLCNMMRPNPL